MANLTRHIPNEDERSQFRQSIEKSGVTQLEPISSSHAGTHGLSTSSAQQPTQMASAITEAQLAQVSEILAFHVGPLASRLVKKMSKQHAAIGDLIEALARHIPDQAERNQFLSRASKL